MESFKSYYAGAILHPTDTFSKLLSNKNKLKYAFYSVTIMAILYTLVYLFLIAGGGEPFKPWLDIPKETYYKYNVFFCAPSMIFGWILSAGAIHIITRIFISTGSFEDLLVGFGFGIGIASWSTGIHDILTSFLGAVHIIDQKGYELILNSPTIWRTLLWIQMLMYLIWFVLLFGLGVKLVYKLNYLKSYILGTFGFLIYQLFFLIFNR